MDEWSIIFYASATICVFAVIIFVAFGSSETQPWNNPPLSNVQPSTSNIQPSTSNVQPSTSNVQPSTLNVLGLPLESSTPGASSQKVLLSSEANKKKSSTTEKKTKSDRTSGRKKSMKRQSAMDEEPKRDDEREWRDKSFPPLPSPRRPSVNIPEDWNKDSP